MVFVLLYFYSDGMTWSGQAYDNPHEALSRIKRHLLTQRAFKEVWIINLSSGPYCMCKFCDVVYVVMALSPWFEAQLWND